jgi:hypothetical protein
MPYGVQDTISINVSLAKGAQAIAKDIARRFLPYYTELYAKVLERVKSDDEFDAAKQKAIDTIVALGLNINSKGADALSWYGGKNGYASVRVNSANSIELDLHSIPLDKAIAVLKLIKE